MVGYGVVAGVLVLTVVVDGVGGCEFLSVCYVVVVVRVLVVVVVVYGRVFAFFLSVVVVLVVFVVLLRRLRLMRIVGRCEAGCVMLAV